MQWRAALVLVVLSCPTIAGGAEDNALAAAIRLQRSGNNREAQRALHDLVPALRSSGDRRSLAQALTAATEASLAVGDYDAAIADARQAFDTHRELGEERDAAWDVNAIGLANMYAGRYPAALEQYERALRMDRTNGDGDGEVTRLNNIGNVHFLQGRYADAAQRYDEARAAVDTHTSAAGRARLRKMTLSNIAVLDQRLGADTRALDAYDRLATGNAMLPSEEAQLLVNRGALLRRLGDPVKALAAYRQAQALFAQAQHRDGEISAWRNIGIAYAMDLDEMPQAVDAFAHALALARTSGNRRGEVQALLYRGETLRRIGRIEEADADLRAALDGAASAGLVEEEWKSLFARGLILDAQDRRGEARRALEQAITRIESVRSDLRMLTLRSEFLADKRDVYDALIRLRLTEEPIAVDEVFRLIERTRARNWLDRLARTNGSASLADVQRTLPPDTLLLEYWTSDAASACVWVTRNAAGILTRRNVASDRSTVGRFIDSVARDDADWQAASRAAGAALLDGLRDLEAVRHVLIVADGALYFVPFEALTIPGDRRLVIERFTVSYLPSAAFLLRPRTQAGRWAWPWSREILAFGDPAPGRADPLADTDRRSARLPYAAEEVHAIAAILRGTAELHLGSDARKAFLADARDVPVLHFSTHAVADIRDPERSRMLLAPAAPDGPADYLFLREIYDLDLSGVRLATISACETEKGRIIRGEGVEGFSRALIAAGAQSAVTTLWDVTDRSGSELMKQFYFALRGGTSTGSALRDAKLAFLRSPLAWSRPRYWAAYVLTGDGLERIPRVVPWTAIVGVPAALAVAVAAVRRRRRR
jgi:CHAT domain-containing protein/tetratricopeptide (TPR) repeat protein